MNYGYRIQVTGKMGARIISVVWCGAYLESWLAKRPKKNQLAKPFFYSMQDPHGRISYTDIAEQIERLAKLAGITRGINMYLFRHTIATQLVKKMTEQEMKQYLG